MNSSTWGWIGLVIILFVTTFGLFWCLTILISVLTFVFGLITYLYSSHDSESDYVFYKRVIVNPLTEIPSSVERLRVVLDMVAVPKLIPKTDKRITGSDLIDTCLQEILGYVIRDYITPWYKLISNDPEFSESSVRRTAQNFAISISNRVKEIDWLPYLTTRLVDDAASHLRLYRQARAKMKNIDIPKSPRNSPLKTDPKLSPKRYHKRNKSETDINWYFNSQIDKKGDTDRGKTNLKVRTETSKPNSLEEHFFDLECKMEKDLVCRDCVCMDIVKEKEFLSELTELLLYLLLPEEDFHCKPMRFVLRELISNCIIRPLLNLYSDPDYINQAIVRLCLRNKSFSSEMFLTVLRITDNCDELKYTKDIVYKDIQLLRSRDSGGEADILIKQQLGSLQYVTKLIDTRLSKLQELDSFSHQSDYGRLYGDWKPLNLPLDAILRNNMALSYFIDYTTSIGQQAYLFFYLNVEGWKISSEQQISDIHINKLKGVKDNAQIIYENIRETAYSIFEQYLSDRSEYKLQIQPALIQNLYFRIKNLTVPPSELWFDDIQSAVYEKLNTQDQFLPGFERSISYLKLLAELDLLNQSNPEEDTISISSIESVLFPNDDQRSLDSSDTASSKSMETKDRTSPYRHSENLRPKTSTDFYSDNTLKVQKHIRSYSDVTEMATTKTPNFLTHQNGNSNQINGAVDLDVAKNESNQNEVSRLKVGGFTFALTIIETGIVADRGKTFGVYAIQVSKHYDTGFLEQWHIYRRYSDFYDLHSKIKDKFADLNKIPFPGKKTFHNMGRAVLEKRMKMLNSYMAELCQRHIMDSHPGLQALLLTFVEQGEYDRAKTGGHISQTIDTIVNPIKSGMRTIKNMPEQIFNTVDEVVGGISKVFLGKQGRTTQEAGKVGAGLDIESDDNIPFRIMLLLMDEVFDLKSRNQWLRRRIVTVLRQIVRTMFGDIVNKKILDYVSLITSPKNVAYYLNTFRNSFWPNGIKAEPKPARDEGVKYRTRVAAKVALLSSLSDEMKHIIGSETSRRGLLTVFELFQRPILNRRLLYVLMEGVICTLFPEKNILDIFQKLHSNSKRIPIKKKTIFAHSR